MEKECDLDLYSLCNGYEYVLRVLCKYVVKLVALYAYDYVFYISSMLQGTMFGHTFQPTTYKITRKYWNRCKFSSSLETHAILKKKKEKTIIMYSQYTNGKVGYRSKSSWVWNMELDDVLLWNKFFSVG